MLAPLLTTTVSAHVIRVRTDSGTLIEFPGQSVRTPDGFHVGWLVGSVDLAVTHGHKWGHCPACNRSIGPAHPRAASLGFTLCPTCDASWQTLCLRRAGRLPVAGEFYCRGCAEIKSTAEMCPKDADGRRRWRCRPCRAEQVRRADMTRKLKGRNEMWLVGSVGLRGRA